MASDKKRLAFIAGMAISAAFLFLAFRGLQPEQFWSSLSEVNLLYLLMAAIIYFLAVVIIALRWQFLLRAVKLVPLKALSQLVFIGYMGNNVYPLRAGDALRIALLRRNHQVPLMRSTTVVVIERLFDGSVMVGFILFSLLFIDLQSTTVETITAVTAPLFAAAMLVAVFLAANPNLLRSFVLLVIRILPQNLGSLVARISEDIIAGLEALRNPLYLVGAIISSIVTWSIEAGTYWLVIFAFRFGVELRGCLALGRRGQPGWIDTGFARTSRRQRIRCHCDPDRLELARGDGHRLRRSDPPGHLASAYGRRLRSALAAGHGLGGYTRGE